MVKKFKHRFYIKQLLIWSLNLTQNADPHKYKYSGYGIGFDSRSKFLFTNEYKGKMLLFLWLMWAYLCILIIKSYYQSNNQHKD